MIVWLNRRLLDETFEGRKIVSQRWIAEWDDDSKFFVASGRTRKAAIKGLRRMMRNARCEVLL